MTEVAEPGSDGEYEPSPDARVCEQVRAYEASGGTEGGTLEDKPVIILTTVGAKSGKVRKNPVMRIVDGDRYVAGERLRKLPTPSCSFRPQKRPTFLARC